MFDPYSIVNKYYKDISSKEAPKYLQKLLSIEKKSELKKYCKSIIIYEEDLALLIHNSEKISYNHYRKHHEFVPSHLYPKKNELDAIGNVKTGEMVTGDGKKYLNKIKQVFIERRMLSVHVFQNVTKWHLFYFDQHDMDKHRNHWKYGSHIHFVNFLWPNLDVNNLWELFNKTESSASGKLHIRYQE